MGMRDEWIKKKCGINMQLSFSLRKEGNSDTTWVNLEDII